MSEVSRLQRGGKVIVCSIKTIHPSQENDGRGVQSKSINCPYLLASHSFNKNSLPLSFQFFYSISSFFFSRPQNTARVKPHWSRYVGFYTLFRGCCAGGHHTSHARWASFGMYSLFTLSLSCHMELWPLNSARAQVYGGQRAEHVQRGPRQRDLKWARNRTHRPGLLEVTAYWKAKKEGKQWFLDGGNPTWPGEWDWARSYLLGRKYQHQ